MDIRVAIISAIVEKLESTEELNNILHQYASYVVGRMGLPYRERGIYIISIVLDAPQDEISTLSGKIGRLDGVTSRTAYAKV